MTSRYSRQIVLPEIGDFGQLLLGKARVLVVGAGGLGSPALLYLTAAGIGLARHGGCIGIIDDDSVDRSNLQRQIVFRESDQGKLKAETALAHLSALNSETRLIAHPTRLDAANALDILVDYDVIIDGSDNFSTKYLINDVAVKLGKPVVYGSILGFEGQVSVFWAKHGPCYRCIYPEPAASHIPNCAEAGTLGGIASVIGSIQAVEACKLSLGLEHCSKHGLVPLLGQLLIFDAMTWDIRKLAFDRKTACPVCSLTPDDVIITDAESDFCISPSNKPISLRELGDLWESGVPIALIDVREAAEWANGHLDGAVNIPLGRLLSQDDVLDYIESSDLIVVYCQHGVRSARAVSFLQANGFEALNLLVDWPA